VALTSRVTPAQVCLPQLLSDRPIAAERTGGAGTEPAQEFLIEDARQVFDRGGPTQSWEDGAHLRIVLGRVKGDADRIVLREQRERRVVVPFELEVEEITLVLTLLTVSPRLILALSEPACF
jgi:hypothetical protein